MIDFEILLVEVLDKGQLFDVNEVALEKGYCPVSSMWREGNVIILAYVMYKQKFMA